MAEFKKSISIYESEFNSLTAIAHKHGYLYPEGHVHAGKMNTAETVKHLVKYYGVKIE